MHDWSEFRIWQQRRADLLREAETRRLAKASRAASQVRVRRIPSLKQELQRHVSRTAKLVVHSRRVWRALTGKGTS